MKNQTSENRREFIRYISFENCSLPQIKENSRKYLLLRIDDLQKTNP